MIPTTFKLTISPFAFLTFRNFIKKYQKRDFATTVFGANILIRYNFGAGFASVGRWRPMTWYSVRRPIDGISQLQYFGISPYHGLLSSIRKSVRFQVTKGDLFAD